MQNAGRVSLFALTQIYLQMHDYRLKTTWSSREIAGKSVSDQ